MIPIERNPRSTRAIPMTPLIDVVFLLMVFFILTTRYVDIEALKLGVLDDAPATETTAPQDSTLQQLVLLGNGAAFLNDRLVYFGQLEDQLDVLFTRTPDASMTIQCDNRVTVQMLVDILDMIKRSGGKDVTVSHWQKQE